MTPPLVIVTGASSGIGRSVAAAFAREGNPLLLLSRTIEPLPELGDHPALYERVDVTDCAAVERAVRAAEERFGGTGCLVNNAGSVVAKPFLEVSPEDYSREIDVDLKGALNCTKAVLPGMVERRAGTVINITSISDRKTSPVAVTYAASKFGLRAVTESLREAHARDNVRFVNVAPGYIRTPLHDKMGIPFEQYCELLGNPDFITSEQFAEIVLYCWKLPPAICIRDIVVAPTNTTF